MKKKSAIKLSVLALLAAGVTFGAVKWKNKEEEERIQKALDDVLIPGAERKLDSLLLTDQSLQDSINFYQHKINQIDEDSLISRSDVAVISKLLDDIFHDWSAAYGEWSSKYFDMYYMGDGDFDEDALPQNVKEQVLYLNGGILKEFDNDSTWTIPGYSMEYIVDHDNGLVGMYPSSIGRPGYGDGRIFAKTSGYDTYFEELIYSLETSIEEVLPAEERKDYGEWERDPGTRLDAPEQEQLLRTLKCFVEKIDNSRHIINPTTLRKLATIVDSLLIKADTKNLIAQRAKYADKTLAFEKAQWRVAYEKQRQTKLLNQYKAQHAAHQMRQQSWTPQRTTHK